MASTAVVLVASVAATAPSSAQTAATASAQVTAPTEAVAPSVSCASPSTPTGTDGLVWSEDFDGAAGSAPDARTWTYDLGAGGWGNGESETYTDSRDNSALDGHGDLLITARKDGDSYTSARLKTQGLCSFQYGRVEARIKIPRGQGIWPAFWMLGDSIGSAGWPGSGEIDIMENIGREPGTVHGTMHGPGYSGDAGPSGSYQLPGGADVADDFHTYAIDWQPGSITWSVDGDEYFHTSPATVPGKLWVFDAPFFIILNVAVGGYWPGYPDTTSTYPQQMTVDYVRVYDDTAGPGPSEPQATTTTLQTSATTVEEGQAVTLTATVDAPDATGTVTMTDGATTLGTVPVTDAGTASLTTSALTVGSHELTASYSGDDAYAPSTSDPVAVTVEETATNPPPDGPGPGPATPQPVAVTVRPSHAKVQVGDPVSITATVVPAGTAASGTGAATGTVEMFDGRLSLGTAPLVQGVATAWTTARTVGTHHVTAVYSGDATHDGARSTATFRVRKVRPASVRVKRTRFVRGTRPRVKIHVGRLSDGARPVGKVRVYVGHRKVATVRLRARAKGHVTVRLRHRYRTAIRVKARFVPRHHKKVAKKASKRVRLVPRRAGKHHAKRHPAKHHHA